MVVKIFGRTQKRNQRGRERKKKEKEEEEERKRRKNGKENIWRRRKMRREEI